MPWLKFQPRCALNCTSILLKDHVTPKIAANKPFKMCFKMVQKCSTKDHPTPKTARTQLFKSDPSLGEQAQALMVRIHVQYLQKQ